MLGTGVNAQRRCVATTTSTVRGGPRTWSQREGRGIRKGNEVAKLYADNTVDVLIYAVEKSLDAYKFGLLHNKQLSSASSNRTVWACVPSTKAAWTKAAA